jgi:hypothetical protein
MMTSFALIEFEQKLRNAKRQFLLDGYTIIPGLWNKLTLDKTLHALETVLASTQTAPKEWEQYALWQRDIPISQLDGIPKRKIKNALAQIYIVGDIAMHHPDLRSMILSPYCIAVAQHILGKDVVCHFSNFTGRAAETGASCRWHRDWPNSYCSTRDGFQIRLMICLDGMESGQGVTRVIPGSHHWDEAMFKCWQRDKPSLNTTGKALLCPPGSLVVLGPTIVHGAERNRSTKPRRNLIAQWGQQRDPLCIESLESLTGYIPQCMDFFTGSQI